MSSGRKVDYGPILNEILEIPMTHALGEGSPNAVAASKLNQINLEEAFQGRIQDRIMAECCLSGLWLAYDYLNKSHEISQAIHTATGSFWHGIMHRREADYWNSKYWFRKVGRHPVIATLQNEVLDYHDPFEYVDEVADCFKARQEDAVKRASEIQSIEWWTLFNFCYESAT